MDFLIRSSWTDARINFTGKDYERVPAFEYKDSCDKNYCEFHMYERQPPKIWIPKLQFYQRQQPGFIEDEYMEIYNVCNSYSLKHSLNNI